MKTVQNTLDKTKRKTLTARFCIVRVVLPKQVYETARRVKSANRSKESRMRTNGSSQRIEPTSRETTSRTDEPS